MKLYGTAAHASVDMSADPILNRELAGLVARHKIDVAVETGTFLGTGSTRFVAEALVAAGSPKRFVTLEVNFANWCRARANLRPYPFVDGRWGLSVPLQRALDFLRDDEMLINHHRYPNIYIDNVSDPVAAYSRELLGQATELEGAPLAAAGSEIRFNGRDFLYDGDDVLATQLRRHIDHKPLIVLDSAGGIGFLEFQIVLEVMTGKGFALLLDDTHHIKHYRSLQRIRADRNFRIAAAGTSWVLATHRLY